MQDVKSRDEKYSGHRGVDKSTVSYIPLRYCLVIIVFMAAFTVLPGQLTDYGPGFQTVMLRNPGAAGCEGDGKLRMSYLNFYPGSGYDFHSAWFSYDSYLEPLHGGAGIYLAGDYLGGIMNDLRGGVSYAYFLQAGRDLFINAGLSASFVRRGFSFGNAVLPDQIDPVSGVILPSSETLADRAFTAVDIAAGFIFSTGIFTGGLAVSHLTSPSLSGSGSEFERIKRVISADLSATFSFSRNNDLKIRPLAVLTSDADWLTAGAGAVLSGNRFSVNTVLLYSTEDYMDLQAGFSVKSGRMTIWYNYRFNVLSHNVMLPSSLLHQTGLSFSLNNVEKRNNIRTIILPEM